jgi:hypothetical protein
MSHANVNYIVFCRIDGVKTLPTDELSESVGVLARVAAEEVTASGGELKAYSSVYGRLVIVPQQISLGLDVAQKMLKNAAEGGVRLAVGVTSGRVEQTEDVLEHNVAGIAINRAARSSTTGRLKVRGLPGIATLSNSTLDHNAAIGGNGEDRGNGFGGGAYVASGATVSAVDNTITHNRAKGGDCDDGSDGLGEGGEVYDLGAFTADTVTVLAHNHASTNGDNLFLEVSIGLVSGWSTTVAG